MNILGLLSLKMYPFTIMTCVITSRLIPLSLREDLTYTKTHDLCYSISADTSEGRLTYTKTHKKYNKLTRTQTSSAATECYIFDYI